MNIFTEIRLLTWRSIRACLRNPIFLFMGVITPVLYLTLFTPILGTLAKNGSLGTDNALNLFIPGMLPIIAFSTGIFTGFSMIDEVESGVLERFRVTPARRFSILSGRVFYDACSVFFQCTLFILIALPFGFRGNVFGLLILFVLLAMLALITSSFGNAMGIIAKTSDRYAPICHAIHLPILLLSGTLLPISLAPKWLQIVAHFNPVYYVVEAARALAMGNFASSPVIYAFSALIPFTIITMFWATNVYKKVVT